MPTSLRGLILGAGVETVLASSGEGRQKTTASSTPGRGSSGKGKEPSVQARHTPRG